MTKAIACKSVTITIVRRNWFVMSRQYALSPSTPILVCPFKSVFCTTSKVKKEYRMFLLIGPLV
jgi:hypothetical protein